MKKSLIAVVLAFSSVAAVAHAEPRGMYQTNSLDVRYSDLNLAHPSGAATMLMRIKSAANRVCGGAPAVRDLRARAEFKDCVRSAVSNAVRQLGAPLVTSMHNGSAADSRYAEGRR